MSNLCNPNFSSQYAFVDGTQIHIKDCNLTHKGKFRSQNNHELTPVNSKKRRPHFRHKNTSDTGGNPMTEWHSEWQSYFPITEKSFFRKPNQIKERIADVILNDTTILEIQQNLITHQNISRAKNVMELANVYLSIQTPSKYFLVVATLIYIIL